MLKWQETSLHENGGEKIIKKEIWEILIYERRRMKSTKEEIKERGRSKCYGKSQES